MFHSSAIAIAIAQTHYLYVTIFVCTQNAPNVITTEIATDCSASASLLNICVRT
ncbi:hypothetical protein [Microcoleus vaginatus]|uniref:hypothetical protein n=1 Tax=Microcoleus vaginatus TaxID=119532 RepID=UPI00403F0F61